MKGVATVILRATHQGNCGYGVILGKAELPLHLSKFGMVDDAFRYAMFSTETERFSFRIKFRSALDTLGLRHKMFRTPVIDSFRGFPG
jgi:hypothetical protein